MSPVAPSTTRRCPACNARLRPTDERCWLCGASTVGVEATAAELKATPIVESADRGSRFSLASLLMFVTLVCVVLGVMTIAPGLGIPLAIVSFITWLRTVSVVRSRTTSGSPLSSGEIILIFLRSVAFTFLVLALTGVAAIAAFAALCFAAISSGGPNGSSTMATAIGCGVVVVAAIAGLVAASRSERRRWRRDRRGP